MAEQQAPRHGSKVALAACGTRRELPEHPRAAANAGCLKQLCTVPGAGDSGIPLALKLCSSRLSGISCAGAAELLPL